MDEIRGVSGHAGPDAAVRRETSGESFAETLKSFIGHVDAQIRESSRVTEAFSAGQEMDLHEVMIAAEKADLSFRLMLQIRNKLLEAYQEIMRLQV